MHTTARLSITLPADMARLVRDKVAEGRYASNSEVIREALRAWIEREAGRAQDLATLRRKIDEADAETDPPLSDDEVAAHFDDRLRRSRAAGRTGA